MEVEKRNLERKSQEKSDVWELEPITFIARLFSNEYSFIADKKFLAVAVIQISGSYAQVMAFHGHVSKNALANLKHKLNGMGVDYVIAERHGKVKTWDIST